MKMTVEKKPIDSVKRRKAKSSAVLSLEKFSKKKTQFQRSSASKMTKERSKIGILKKFFGFDLKAVIFSLLRKSIVKTTAFTLIIGLNWSAISLITGTDACFNDVEISKNNILAAGILDFELSSENDFSPEVVSGQNSERTIEVINYGAMDYRYKARVEDPVGVLCSYLYLEDDTGGDPKPLNSFVSDEVLFSEKQVWTFQAFWDGTGVFWQNEECQFDLVYEGQQENSGGFSDVEKIKNTVTAGGFGEHLLISKVYYDVCDRTDGSCGEYKGEEPKHEWIELYNPTSQIVKLKNWQICDNSRCETINPNNASVNIFPLGYAILAHDASILKYWNILNGGAEATVIYQLGENFWMDNNNDMLVLKDPAGGIVDQMNWGTPCVGWSNYNSDLWDSGAIDVAEGHMLGRVPVGWDADEPDDWHDLELPSVTVKYPSESIIVWHIGGNYDITWEAFNNNVGDDLELTIDIYYSNDSGKSWGVVEKGTENDGIYTWENIRPFILTEDGKPYSTLSSRARIKVVAVDHTRNFMLRSWDMSDNDFCPPIDCGLFTAEEIEILVEMGVLEGSECSTDDANNSAQNEADEETLPNSSSEGNNIGQEDETGEGEDADDMGDTADIGSDDAIDSTQENGANGADTGDKEETDGEAKPEVGGEDDLKNEDSDADAGGADDTEDGDDTNTKDEKYNLILKEENLPDEGDGDGEDDDANGSTQARLPDEQEDETNGEDDGISVENDDGEEEGGLNKNMIDSVQVSAC